MSAGAGYSKRHSVATFLAGQPAHVIWLRVAKLDNVATRLWRHLAKALEQNDATLFAGLEEQGFPATRESFDQFMRLLARKTREGKQVFIVFEDYQHITDPSIHRFVEQLALLQMENLCLMLLAQRPVGLELAEHERQGLVFHLTARDLQYTMPEITALLYHHHRNYPGSYLDDFYRRTQGWPMAVRYLVAQQDPGPDALGLQPDDLQGPMHLFNQLYYATYPAAFQQLLVRLAGLPLFSAGLVAALGATPLKAVLGALEEHPYVILDPISSAYSFHSMYRDFLLNKQAALPEALLAETQAVAGDWFVQNGFPMEAVACYEKCGRYDDMCATIAGLPTVCAEDGMVDFVLDCLARLPADYAETHPQVRCTWAAMLLNGGRIDEGEALLKALLEEYEAKEPTPENTAFLGEVHIMLADYSFVRNDDALLEHYRRAAECLPDGSRLRDARFMLAENHSVLYLRNNHAGELDYMVRLFAQAMPIGAAVMNGCGQGFEHLAAAEAAYFTWDMAAAQTAAYRALYAAGEVGQHDIVCNARFLLVRQAFMEGNYAESLRQLQELNIYVEQNGLAWLSVLRDCVAGWFYIRLGHFDRVPKWLSSQTVSAVRQTLAGTGRPQLIWASCLLAQGRYAEMLALSERADAFYAEIGLWGARLHMHIMRAVCLFKTGDTSAAMDALYAAYDMSWQNGIVTPFVEQGKNMRTLIEAARHSALPFQADWLDTVQKKSSTYAKRLSTLAAEDQKRVNAQSGTAGTLTDREVQVVRYLAQGLTRDEIGQQMHISVNTVKSLLKQIYNKLDAVNRADAVHIATLMGLIA
ncbi:MAG: LuxR C-terminal-related transcriptional regulator [Oscillospiraceae bacterium]